MTLYAVYQVRTTVSVLGQTFGSIDLLVMKDVLTFKDTSFDAMFGCDVLHHVPWIRLDIAGGRVMFDNSLTRGINQRGQKSNYLAHGIKDDGFDESTTMDFQSRVYMKTLQNLEPVKVQNSSGNNGKIFAEPCEMTQRQMIN